MAVPDRLQHRVGEAQVGDVHHRLLAEEVVDPAGSGPRQHLVDLLVQLARRLQVVAERLLDHHPGVLRSGPALPRRVDHGRRTAKAGSRGRRPGASPPLIAFLDALVGVGLVVLAGGRRCSFREPLEDVLVDLLASARPGSSIASRACSTRSSSFQSLRPTPMIRLRACRSRLRPYSARKVIFLARSPVIPKITRTSAGCATLSAGALPGSRGATYASATSARIAASRNPGMSLDGTARNGRSGKDGSEHRPAPDARWPRLRRLRRQPGPSRRLAGRAPGRVSLEDLAAKLDAAAGRLGDGPGRRDHREDRRRRSPRCSSRATRSSTAATPTTATTSAAPTRSARRASTTSTAAPAAASSASTAATA